LSLPRQQQLDLLKSLEQNTGASGLMDTSEEEYPGSDSSRGLLPMAQ